MFRITSPSPTITRNGRGRPMNENCCAFPQPWEKMPDGGCKILTEMICLERRCKFFKTPSQALMAKMKSVDRRMSKGMVMNADDIPYMMKLNERKKRGGN